MSLSGTTALNTETLDDAQMAQNVNEVKLDFKNKTTLEVLALCN